MCLIHPRFIVFRVGVCAAIVAVSVSPPNVHILPFDTHGLPHLIGMIYALCIVDSAGAVDRKENMAKNPWRLLKIAQRPIRTLNTSSYRQPVAPFIRCLKGPSPATGAAATWLFVANGHLISELGKYCLPNRLWPNHAPHTITRAQIHPQEKTPRGPVQNLRDSVSRPFRLHSATRHTEFILIPSQFCMPSGRRRRRRRRTQRCGPRE